MKTLSMKALTGLFFLTVFLSSSCEKEVIPRKSNEELVELTRKKIISNESILEGVFVETSGVVTRAAIANGLKNSSSKLAFIANMNALVDELFAMEIQDNSDQLAADVFMKLGDIKGAVIENTINEVMLDTSAIDPLENYANRVNAILDAKIGEGASSQIILVKNVAIGSENTAAPVETLSLNFAKIKLMYDLQTRVITGSGTSAETEDGTDEILSSAGVPPVAIALLLPAVQKTREYNGTSLTAQTGYLKWLDSNVNPEINGGLNRDIIRRYNAAGFMGALQLLLSKDFNADNQDIASALLLRARYQASLMFIWGEIWDKTKLAAVMQDRVKGNHSVLESAFAETAKVITRAAILNARSASADKAAFVASMNTLVKGIFDREVQKKSGTYSGGVVIATGDVTGDGTTSKLEAFVIKQAADPLEDYATEIQTLINNRMMSQGNTSAELGPLYAIVHRVTQNGVEKESFMSVISGNLGHAKELKQAILYGRKSGSDPHKPVEDLALLYNIPKPLMAMLLPAIQKVREYNGTLETADTPYLQWLDSLDPLITGGVTHDVVTKYDAAGFLGALNLFASEKYRNNNQDYASLFLLKARYQASLVMIFNDLWDK
jgi:hypothetical protein